MQDVAGGAVWRVDKSAMRCDEDGWQYHFDFDQYDKSKPHKGERLFTTYVRRRRWLQLPPSITNQDFESWMAAGVQARRARKKAANTRRTTRKRYLQENAMLGSAGQ